MYVYIRIEFSDVVLEFLSCLSARLRHPGVGAFVASSARGAPFLCIPILKFYPAREGAGSFGDWSWKIVLLPWLLSHCFLCPLVMACVLKMRP